MKGEGLMRKELLELRREMERLGIDLCLVPMDDFHQSEYVAPYFKAVEFLTGFTGESGQAVVGMEDAWLFTDGRFFIQAEQELRGSGFRLMKMGEKGVPSLTSHIADCLPEHGCLSFDGRCVDESLGSRLDEIAKKKSASIKYDTDLVGRIWKNRPPLPSEPVFILDEKWAGRSAAEKISDIRKKMREEGADVHLITSLEDIAWILNLRGGDILYTPVFLAYFLLKEDAVLFANSASFDENVLHYLSGLGVRLRPYEEAYEAVSELCSKSVLLEKGKTNYAMLRCLNESCSVIDRFLPSSSEKAVKNETEIRNERAAHIKDGVAMTKYCYFLKHAFKDGRLTQWARDVLRADRLSEVTGADYLFRLRSEQEGFLELSFPTISAYGKNAALPHYSPSEDPEVEILPRGLYLVDSGGHYLEGTTDITRTIAMGPVTEEERKHYTMVVRAMLRLGDVRILRGASGVSFDYAARELFWREGLNYNHGTGHGVGYLLSVHERPNGIRYRLVPERMDSEAFRPGYITSDEPGIYIEGSHGVRMENLTVCESDFENEYGEFLRFEFLTMCPIDLDALDTGVMTQNDLSLLNAYHKQVFDNLSPYFSGEELEWLKEATRPMFLFDKSNYDVV